MWNSHISFILGFFRLSGWWREKKKKKSTIHKYISRYDKRAGCSKKKILLLCEFYDQMHVNAVALHLQHTWMPYPQFQQPLCFSIASQSFHLSLFIVSCWFFFFPTENKLNMTWPSFFLRLACSSPLHLFIMFREVFPFLFPFHLSIPWIPISFMSLL